jgi:hypothetical protein
LNKRNGDVIRGVGEGTALMPVHSRHCVYGLAWPRIEGQSIADHCSMSMQVTENAQVTLEGRRRNASALLLPARSDGSFESGERVGIEFVEASESFRDHPAQENT